MNDLLNVIAELGLELHPDRIAIVASKIERIGSVDQFSVIRTSFGPNTDKELIDKLNSAWKSTEDMSPRDLAQALRGAAATAKLQESRGNIDLVWTGPSTGLVPVRQTEQVLCEVIESAKRRLFLISFVAYSVDSIISALKNAIGRNVQIDILLELSNENGGRVNHNSQSLMKEKLPSAKLYCWNGENGILSSGYSGAVHAKCAVADGELAFITSANLTSAAMDKNMELGVLVKGGNLPAELHRHFDALISSRIIEKVESKSE